MDVCFIDYECECGNHITFADEWEPGFRYNTPVDIRCKTCDKIHKTDVNGIIIEIEGGEEVW